MKKTIFWVFCIYIFFLIFSIGYCTEDRIVAVVNNDVITSKDVQDFAAFMRLQLPREYSGRELNQKLSDLENKALERLIEERLMLQEARKASIVIDEKRIQDRIDELKKQFPSEEDFNRYLISRGQVLADLQKKIKEQLLMYYFVELKLRPEIKINPEEVTEYYNNNKSVIMVPEGRDFEIFILENKDLAETVSYSLRSGKKTEDLVTKYPMKIDRIKAKKGADLRGDIERIVFNMGINEVSRPVLIDGKFYVFRLVNIIPARPQTLSEAQAKIHSFLMDRKLHEKIKSMLDDLKKKSYVKIKDN